MDLSKKISAPENATCFPSVGLFMYYYDERMNYTEATSTCEGHRGYLAQIVSDTRTNFISFMIQQQIFDVNKAMIGIPQTTLNESVNVPIKIPIKHAFIGLKELRSKGNFVDSLDIPLKCFRYRAWAPRVSTDNLQIIFYYFFSSFFSIPGKNRMTVISHNQFHCQDKRTDIHLFSEETRPGCVAITASRSWKMFDCRKRAPFICELKPTKPRRINRQKFNRRCSLKRSNN